MGTGLPGHLHSRTQNSLPPNATPGQTVQVTAEMAVSEYVRTGDSCRGSGGLKAWPDGQAIRIALANGGSSEL